MGDEILAGDHDSHSSRKNRNTNTFRGKIMKGVPLLCLGRTRRTSRMGRETDASTGREIGAK